MGARGITAKEGPRRFCVPAVSHIWRVIPPSVNRICFWRNEALRKGRWEMNDGKLSWGLQGTKLTQSCWSSAQRNFVQIAAPATSSLWGSTCWEIEWGRETEKESLRGEEGDKPREKPAKYSEDVPTSVAPMITTLESIPRVFISRSSSNRPWSILQRITN